MSKRTLVFDGDGAQYLPCGKACSLCGIRQTTNDTLVFIRVRERRGGETAELAHICPECVARMFLQATRLDLWRFVSGTVLGAIRRLLNRRRKLPGNALTTGEESP